MLRRVALVLFFVVLAAGIAAPAWACENYVCINSWQAFCNQTHNQCGARCQEDGPPSPACLTKCDEAYIRCWEDIDRHCCQYVERRPQAVAVLASLAPGIGNFEDQCGNSTCMEQCEATATQQHTACVTGCGEGSQAGPCIDRCNVRYQTDVDWCPHQCCMWVGTRPSSLDLASLEIAIFESANTSCRSAPDRS